MFALNSKIEHILDNYSKDSCFSLNSEGGFRSRVFKDLRLLYQLIEQNYGRNTDLNLDYYYGLMSPLDIRIRNIVHDIMQSRMQSSSDAFEEPDSVLQVKDLGDYFKNIYVRSLCFADDGRFKFKLMEYGSVLLLPHLEDAFNLHQMLYGESEAISPGFTITLDEDEAVDSNLFRICHRPGSSLVLLEVDGEFKDMYEDTPEFDLKFFIRGIIKEGEKLVGLDYLMDPIAGKKVFCRNNIKAACSDEMCTEDIQIYAKYCEALIHIFEEGK